MVKYVMNKGDHDGFIAIHPKDIFTDAFDINPRVTIDTEYAYYTRGIFKKIEKQYPTVTRISSKSFINGNNILVEDEIVYVDGDNKMVIAIKLHWDLGDYLIGEDIPEMSDEDAIDMLSEDGVSGYDALPVSIKKTDRFQAKLTIYLTKPNEQIEKWFSKLISKDRKPKPKERELNIICSDPQSGIYLKSFKTNKADFNLSDNYNEDFVPVDETILKRLSKKNDNGIVLLHSEPGCGKTTYLRYLTQQIKTKRLIYLPPDLTHKLADPDFMSFLMSYPDSILIIEDAENSLQKRDSGGNQAVSNLLNNSDGLLGDALKLQIVCTFNCDLRQIDPALMRPGRLIAEYKFEKLTPAKTASLLKKLYGEDTPLAYRVGAMTLAEIYNADKKQFKTKDNSSSIGFKR